MDVSEEFRDRRGAFLSLLETEGAIRRARRVASMVANTKTSQTPPDSCAVTRLRVSSGYIPFDFEDEQKSTNVTEETDGISNAKSLTSSDSKSKEDHVARRRHLRLVKIQSFTDADEAGRFGIHFEDDRRGSAPVVIHRSVKETCIYVLKVVIPGDGNGEFRTGVMITNQLTIGDIWTEVARAKGENASTLRKKYIMTYAVGGEENGKNSLKFQLINDKQLFIQTHLHAICSKNSGELFLVFEKPPIGDENDEASQGRINALLGTDFFTTLHPQSLDFDSENSCNAYLARRKLHSYVEEIVAQRDPEEYSLSMEVENEEVNIGIQSRIPMSERKDVYFYFELQEFVESVNVFLTADEVMKIVALPAFVPGLSSKEYNEMTKEYCFQLKGEGAYLSGDIVLIRFTAIQRAIFQGDQVHLKVITKPNPTKDKVQLLQWPRLDENTSQVCDDALLTELNAEEMNTVKSSTTLKSAWDCTETFKFYIESLTNLASTSRRGSLLRGEAQGVIRCDTPIQVNVSLYHGEKCIHPGLSTTHKKMTAASEVYWQEEIESGIKIQDLPKEVKMLIEIKCSRQTMYWGTCHCVDPNSNALKVGTCQLHLWPAFVQDEHSHDSHCPSPIAPAVNNPSTKAVVLTIRFDTSLTNIIFPEDIPSSFSDNVLEGLQNFYSAEDFQIKWFPEMLTKSLHWNSKDDVGAVHHFVQEIRAKGNLPLMMSFRLLDSDIADSEVRKLAVEKLNVIPIPDMKYYMLQLVQALKFEWKIDSPLSRTLLKVALSNKLFGGIFFWCVCCELCNPMYREQFSILLEAYLRGCGEDMMSKFENQLAFIDAVHHIGIHFQYKDHVKSLPVEEKTVVLRKLLEEAELQNSHFHAPYSPGLDVGRLDISKAKLMKSKKEPIWLEFVRVDPAFPLQKTVHKMIVKRGDDLRQDMMILRIFTLINRIWQEDNLDICLTPYKCIATTCNSGIIEVVNGQTIADAAPSVTKDKELYKWLQRQLADEKGHVDLDQFHQAVLNFTKSLAGYSVVTFVLGITDRHNDNIMIAKDGNIFHIDFGHILGNVKTFMGFSRERTPFILTPVFMHVMGGEDSVYFEAFQKLCILGFLSLRRRANLVLNLFALMRHSGIPELTSLNQLKHIRDNLYLDKETEEEAGKAFHKDIRRSLNLNWTTVPNWWVHVKWRGKSNN